MTEPGAAPPPPLPRRPPHPIGTHWLVDSAVAFCVLLLPCLFLRVPLVVIAIAALVLGAPIAPWTRRREIEALARRPDPDEPT